MYVGFNFLSLPFGVGSGLGFKARGLVRIWGLGFTGLRLKVDLGVWVCGLQVKCLGSFQCLGFRVFGQRFGVWGLRFRDWVLEFGGLVLSVRGFGLIRKTATFNRQMSLVTQSSVALEVRNKAVRGSYPTSSPDNPARLNMPRIKCTREDSRSLLPGKISACLDPMVLCPDPKGREPRLNPTGHSTRIQSQSSWFSGCKVFFSQG